MNKDKKWVSYWGKRKSFFIEECNLERNQSLRDIAQPEVTQKRVVEDIIKISKNSLYWKEHNYSNINDMYSFRDTLPIMKYDDFAPMLDKETHTKGAVFTLVTKFI